MRRVFLGSSGLAVSCLAMGTQTFGWGVDEAVAWEMADRFVEAGGNFFDTSSTYNNGTSESILGGWAKSRKRRHDLILATKVFFPTGEGPNDFGLSRKHILQSVEDSLTRLEDGVHRPLPGALLRYVHAARRDPSRIRGPREGREGPLCRGIQFHCLPADPCRHARENARVVSSRFPAG